MNNRDNLLDALFDATLNDLLGRINSGEASAADISNALKFLQQNGISASASKKPAIATLAGKVLPFAKG
jgi:hypothetical protein